MARTRVPQLITLCALAASLFTSDVHAQPPGGGFGGPGFGGPGFGGPGFGGPGFGGPGFGGPGFGGPGFGGPFGAPSVSTLLTLAQDSAVWDEIKISDEQLGKVTRIRSGIDRQSRKLRDEMRSQMQAMARPGGDNGQPVDPAAAAAAQETARQAARQAMAENTTSMQEQSEAALKKILKPAQFLRLQQIDLQQQGPLVVVRPDVAKALNLSSAQIDQAQMVITQMTDQGREQFMQNQRSFLESLQNRNNANSGNNSQPPTDAERESMREQFQTQMQTQMEKMRATSQTLKDKAVQQVSQTLTKAQRNKFNAMLGPAFDLALLNDGRGPIGLGVFGAPPGGPNGPGGASAVTPGPKTTSSTKSAAAPSIKSASATKAATKK